MVLDKEIKMNWKDWLDVGYKIVSVLVMLGILKGVTRLVIWAVRFGPRFESVEKQSVQYGTMIQQITRELARIEGWITGRDGKYKQKGE
jgi:hypothetical protein